MSDSSQPVLGYRDIVNFIGFLTTSLIIHFASDSRWLEPIKVTCGTPPAGQLACIGAILWRRVGEQAMKRITWP